MTQLILLDWQNSMHLPESKTLMEVRSYLAWLGRSQPGISTLHRSVPTTLSSAIEQAHA